VDQQDFGEVVVRARQSRRPLAGGFGEAREPAAAVDVV
jgi:hypothetical protein